MLGQARRWLATPEVALEAKRMLPPLIWFRTLRCFAILKIDEHHLEQYIPGLEWFFVSVF